MSISSINKSAQTALVPNTLLGYSTNGVSAIEITPTSITLGGDLTTTPIYVEVSAQTGLTTNRVGGLNVNCNFDMNQNSITNVDTLSNTNPVSITGGDVYMTATGVGIVNIQSGDNTQINAGENFSVQTNSNTGFVSFTTSDIASQGKINWNSYPLSISFFNLWNGGFNYPTTGPPNNWEMVRSTFLTFPTNFNGGTWAVHFSINLFNQGSSLGDKGLAMYFDFFDGGGNPISGNNYNQTTPFAQWFNPSMYTATSITPMSITYIDYFNFSASGILSNPLELRLWWYGDQSQSQNFQVSTQFTLMTLI